MEDRRAREEKTLDIATALGLLVVVVAAGHLVVWLAYQSVGVGQQAVSESSRGIVIVACVSAVAYLVRARKRRRGGSHT